MVMEMNSWTSLIRPIATTCDDTTTPNVDETMDRPSENLQAIRKAVGVDDLVVDNRDFRWWGRADTGNTDASFTFTSTSERVINGITINKGTNTDPYTNRCLRFLAQTIRRSNCGGQ